MIKNKNKIVNIIGFPMDLGSGRRGVDMGPSAIRIAGIEKKLLKLGYRVIDSGDIFIQNIEQQIPKTFGTDPQLKYLPEILKTTKILGKKVEKVLEQNQFPLCLGGDHSMAIGTIAGISSYCRNRNLELGVIWVDAHADMNTDKTTPSGNIHGMPMACSLGIGDDRLVNILDFSPKVKPENCALIGIRSIDTLEKKNIKDLGITVYTMADIDRQGIHRIIAKVLRQFQKKVNHIHVSFDLDVVDPTFAPGVGTPVPGGLSYREAHLLMESIAECGCMSSLEVTEVNPILDSRNKSAEFATDIIASSMGERIL